MTTKLSKMVTSGVPTYKVKWHRRNWSWKITWQFKFFFLHYLSVYHHQIWQDNDLPWGNPNQKATSSGLARSLDRLKSIYLQYHSVYSHQTWQSGDLSSGALTYKLTWILGHVFLQDHVKINNILSPRPQCLSSPNLAGWWLTLWGS